VSDIDTAAVDSLKVLDPERPIREADNLAVSLNVRYWVPSGQRPVLGLNGKAVIATNGFQKAAETYLQIHAFESVWLQDA
jgi:hypothetical protein